MCISVISVNTSAPSPIVPWEQVVSRHSKVLELRASKNRPAKMMSSSRA